LFYPLNGDLTNQRPSCSKLVVASQIFSDFIGDNDDFSKIGFDE
jgi:hypothetical protein